MGEEVSIGMGGHEATVRNETPGDAEAVHRVQEWAFGRPDEANAVDLLRARNKAALSLVAVKDGQVVGHILFSPVTVSSAPKTLKAAGLGPLGVLPAYQRQGIGTLLVEAGIEKCREGGYGCVVVLGHAHFYSRFGFAPASRFNLKCQWNVPDETFMALVLREDALRGCSGVVQYEPEFYDL